MDDNFNLARLLSHLTVLADCLQADVKELAGLIQHEPAPSPEVGDVRQAAQWMDEGKKVRRERWPATVFMSITRLDLFYTGPGGIWIPTAEDLFAEDWVVCDQ